MTKPIRVLLQTTIPFTEDDWHIQRFSLLRDKLASSKDEAGNPRFEVVARNRESDAAGDDRVLSTLDTSDFNELRARCSRTSPGCLSFVAEPPGDGYKRNPEALDDIKYMNNAASWLAGS